MSILVSSTMAEGIVKLAKDTVVIVWDENFGSFEGS
jgi:hypothetical protein